MITCLTCITCITCPGHVLRRALTADATVRLCHLNSLAAECVTVVVDGAVVAVVDSIAVVDSVAVVAGSPGTKRLGSG